jgi:signal transduction histidine kinase
LISRASWPRRIAGGQHWLCVAAAVLGLTAWPDGAFAAGAQKRVLVLYATRRDAQIVTIGERELPRVVEERLGEEIDYYSEYIDRARFPDQTRDDAFREFLRAKYQSIRFDVIITMQELALEVVGGSQNDLFPGVPVVYFANSSDTRPIANSTGVTAGVNLAGSVELAAQLQPGLRQVFVVSGATEADGAFEKLARKQLQPLESRLKITFLAGLPAKDLEARVAALPEHSMVYYLMVDRDGAGATFHPLEYLDRLAAVANVPIYCWVDSAMGHGIVGGRLKDQTAEVDAVGELAVRVLHGELPSNILPLTPDLNVTQVDWRQIKRWGIGEARIPAGTTIRFRQPSTWDRYSDYIIVVAIVVVAQTVLIAALLIQRARRREAEERAHGSQEALRSSYERIRDMGGRLLSAQETERARIARELHDDISQQVALLSIDLELLARDAQAPSDKQADEALGRAQGIAKSLHDLSHRLHPAKLRLIGLVSALHGLRHELSQSGITITFTHENVPKILPPDLTLCLFRIVQESVQNATKHSGATEVSVHLIGDHHGIVLTIADDGSGFNVDAVWGKGLGLISMGERLEAVGGTFAIHSTPGAGTRVEVVVPFQAVSGSVPA